MFCQFLALQGKTSAASMAPAAKKQSSSKRSLEATTTTPLSSTAAKRAKADLESTTSQQAGSVAPSQISKVSAILHNRADAMDGVKALLKKKREAALAKRKLEKEREKARKGQEKKHGKNSAAHLYTSLVATLSKVDPNAEGSSHGLVK